MVSTATGIQASFGFDEDLAGLAAFAAAEIDGLLLARSASLSAFEELQKHLELSIQNAADAAQPSPKSPSRAVVFSDAFRNEETSEILDVAQLETALRQIASTRPSTESSRAELEHLRAFCLNLSKSILAFQGSVFEPEAHPFRS